MQGCSLGFISSQTPSPSSSLHPPDVCQVLQPKCLLWDEGSMQLEEC